MKAQAFPVGKYQLKMAALVMSDPAMYSAVELLRDGQHVEIRALRLDDRANLLAAVGRTSSQSLYRRFFAVKRGFTEQEIAFFSNVDFVSHVALVAVMEEGGQPFIVGGDRYIIMQPGQAEVAFVGPWCKNSCGAVATAGGSV